MTTRNKPAKPDQTAAFQAAARELGCDESASSFDKALGVIGRAKPPAKAEPKNKKKQLDKR
jgi:hypothetical protein